MEALKIVEENVFWITGLAGSGKTTIARKLYLHLRKQRSNVVLLDGDMLREICGGDLGHSIRDREMLAKRYARMCRMLAMQGQAVVCATISMFRKVREWNRENITNYKEIFLDVPMKELIRRDQKNLYSRALNGEIRNVVGIDIKAELPEAPDLRILNDGSCSPDAILKDCVRFFELD